MGKINDLTGSHRPEVGQTIAFGRLSPSLRLKVIVVLRGMSDNETPRAGCQPTIGRRRDRTSPSYRSDRGLRSSGQFRRQKVVHDLSLRFKLADSSEKLRFK